MVRFNEMPDELASTVLLTPSQVWPFVSNIHNALDGGAEATQRGGQKSPAEQELVDTEALPSFTSLCRLRLLHLRNGAKRCRSEGSS